MSTLQNQGWSDLSKESLSSRYEKCRHITEEIYKRINITFQIKKLETANQSDVSEHSDQIDSNELSNETDLFACDKSDSIPSSTEPEQPPAGEKYININNNEETKKKAVAVYKRPRKRFRKRVKKRQSKPASESDGSSDEALPLSRVVELDKSPESGRSASPDRVMGVPKIIIITKDQKPKILAPPKKAASPPNQKASHDAKPILKIEMPPQEIKTDPKHDVYNIDNEDVAEIMPMVRRSDKKCSICSSTFRGDRALSRHMATSHTTASSTNPQRDSKPA